MRRRERLSRVGSSMMMLLVLLLVFAGVAFAAEIGNGSPEGIKEILSGALMQLLKYAFAVLVPVIGTILAWIFTLLLSKIKNDRIRALAIQGVLWVEDKYGSEPGDTKLGRAINELIRKTGVSQEEADRLIREAYQRALAPFKQGQTS